MQPPALYKTLLSNFGEQYWWPVSSSAGKPATYAQRSKLTGAQKLEICAGAILTQNTAWKNVERALANLKEAELISAEKIACAPKRKLARLIRPAGYFNQKSEYLKVFCKHLKQNYNSNINLMFKKPLPVLRKELLSLKGIGNETADSILCYAAAKPSFVIDAYTLRFLSRFYAMENLRYNEAKQFFESALPRNLALFQEFHAQFVELGKHYCNPKPKCIECFLAKNCNFPKNHKNV